jgi:hypothetical protein
MRQALHVLAAAAAVATLGSAMALAGEVKLKAPSAAGGGAPGLSEKVATGGYPTFSQVNGYKAKAATKHASCGGDCWTHALVSKKGNLDVTVKMGFSCPAGDGVEQIYYSLGPGGPVEHAYEYGGGAKQQQKIATVVLQPWTPAQFEAAANQALGGNWQGLGPSGPQTGQIDMSMPIRVFANCITAEATKHKDFVIHTRLTATDTDWTPPPGIQTSQDSVQ